MSINKWRVPKGICSHLLMDGGILFVPPEEIEEFNLAYIEEINLGSKLYVVEQKTEKFKFFIDLDYRAEGKLEDDEIVQFCFEINQIIPGRCLISKARPRPEKGFIKSGVHLHWPNLIVDRIEAINFRSKLIYQLGEGKWDTIIDASVYGGSGLRMLWSYKKPAGDPYRPWKEVGVPNVLLSKTPSLEMLNLFSIRVNTDSFIERSLRDVSIPGFEEYIQKNMMGQNKAQIKRLQRHGFDGWFIQTDSKFCERIKREHKSNHVWFSIYGGRIYQKCFDAECSEFQGRQHILPPSIVEQLNEVAIVGSPTASILMDLHPNGTSVSLQEVRTDDSSIFGPGPVKLGTFFSKH